MVKVEYQGHNLQKMAVAGVMVFHKHILFFSILIACYFVKHWLYNNRSEKQTAPGDLKQTPTRHNSVDSVPTSNLVCITEVAIRTILCTPGII